MLDAGPAASRRCASPRDAGTRRARRPSTLPGAADTEADEKRRKARKDAKVGAVLHRRRPVRYWDHDLGPDEVRLLRRSPQLDEDAEPRRPHPGARAGRSTKPAFAVTPDGVDRASPPGTCSTSRASRARSWSRSTPHRASSECSPTTRTRTSASRRCRATGAGPCACASSTPPTTIRRWSRCGWSTSSRATDGSWSPIPTSGRASPAFSADGSDDLLPGRRARPPPGVPPRRRLRRRSRG